MHPPSGHVASELVVPNRLDTATTTGVHTPSTERVSDSAPEIASSGGKRLGMDSRGGPGPLGQTHSAPFRGHTVTSPLEPRPTSALGRAVEGSVGAGAEVDAGDRGKSSRRHRRT
jgi:hypothetical protein